ncbi:MAG: Spy/CpxP family protein refolding chaperone [Blastocatellales bacterium]
MKTFMKTMNKLYVLAITALLAVPTILAQSAQSGGSQEPGQDKGAFGKHHGRGGRGMHGGMFRKLNLTDAQKAQMKQLRQSHRERTQPLRQELRAKMQQLREANQGGAFNEALAAQTLTETAGLRAKLMGEHFKLRQEMMALLTPEQKTQFDQMREQFKARRAERQARRAQRQSQAQ